MHGCFIFQCSTVSKKEFVSGLKKKSTPRFCSCIWGLKNVHFVFSLSHSKCLLTALFRHMIPNVNCIVQTRIRLCEGCPVVGAYLNMVVVSLVCKLCLGFLYFQP